MGVGRRFLIVKTAPKTFIFNHSLITSLDHFHCDIRLLRYLLLVVLLSLYITFLFCFRNINRTWPIFLMLPLCSLYLCIFWCTSVL